MGLASFEEKMTGLTSKLSLGLNGNTDGTRVRLRQISAVVLLVVLAGCTGRPDGIEPVRPFNAQRYKGEWFEIMRLDHSFERGLTNVTATYTLRDDESVGVLNRGFDRKNCRWKEADGRAVFLGARDTASLSVTFFWPFAGGYHVFALDQQDYEWAMIAGPSLDYLWILARRPDLDADNRNRLVSRARELGFPVDQLILVDHSVPTCLPGG
jgi:apolipoprotein D and lipocalin family protein